jgi:hypothetical protein
MRLGPARVKVRQTNSEALDIYSQRTRILSIQQISYQATNGDTE